VRIVFAGTPEFSVPALDALQGAGFRIVAVYTQPDRPAGRGRTLKPAPVKRRAMALGLPVEQPASLRVAESVDRLAEYRADLMVVVAYGLILPQKVLDTPRLGCLNIHASLLPRWRGAAPIQRAILAGDEETGITIMKMDEGLDTGPVLLRRPLSIGQEETAGHLHDRLARLGAEAIVSAIHEWTSGQIEPDPQPEQGVTYAAKIQKAEARIDWQSSAEEIGRHVRAFNPWPVAETSWDGRQLRIWEARALTGQADRAPGTVVEAAAGRIVVATPDGLLQLLRLQLPGKRPVSASELLNSHALAGVRFG
jgi:methionyl-tRNA formyltransferase